MKSVVFENKERGIKVTIKTQRSNHPLRNWDETKNLKNEDIEFLLDLPEVKQTKVTDNFDKKNKKK